MNRALVFFTALLLLFVGAVFIWFGTRADFRGGGSVSSVDNEYTPPAERLTEFEFTDQLAKPFGSKDLEGKVWMASFFFSSCPSICRQQNSEITKIQNRFSDEDVTILSISVTPKQDTPKVLLLYANQFDADHERWKFLTGKDIEYVKQVGADILQLPAADETHTSDVVLIDQQGQICGFYGVTNPQEFTKLVLKVEELLANPSGGAKDSGDAELTTDVAPTVLQDS